MGKHSCADQCSRRQELQSSLRNIKRATDYLTNLLFLALCRATIRQQDPLKKCLSTMRSAYAGQEKNLLLKSQIRDFTDKLQGMLQLIKDMWNAEDQKIQSIHQLADHSFTLQHQIKLNKERQQQLEKAISDLKTKQKHIKTEAASKAVYLSQADFDKSTIWLAECKQKKDDAENQYNRLEHKVKALNAAKSTRAA